MTTMYRVRAVISGFQGGPGLSTTYHQSLTIPGTAADALVAVNRVRGAWDVVKSLLPNVVSVQVSGVVDVISDQQGALLGSFTVATPAVVVGTVAAAAGPAQVAAGLTLETGTIIGRRRLRGRLFLSPLAQTVANTLAPTPGVAAAVAAMGVALLTNAPPASNAPVGVWHRPKFSKDKPPVLLVAGQFAAASGSSAATKWFSIRSRRD